MKDYWTHLLKNDTSSGDMDEKLDNWLDSFEKFYKKYIIMPSLSLNYLLIEEIFFVTVRSPPGFINRGNETRCYLNATFKLLYSNVIFIQLVIKINCYTMLNGPGGESQHFVHNLQKIMIMKELQKKIGEIFLRGKKTISTDMFFILENIRINCQMDANEFEGLLYNMLSEEPFENHKLDMTDEKDDYTIFSSSSVPASMTP